MPISFSLKQAQKWARVGDLTLALINTRQNKRLLIIMPTFRKNSGWVVIPESNAYLWNIQAEDPTARLEAIRHTQVSGMAALRELGIEDNQTNLARLVNLILDWLPDLIRLRSIAPEAEKPVVVGEVSLTIDGEVVHQAVAVDEEAPADDEVAYG